MQRVKEPGAHRPAPTTASGQDGLGRGQPDRTGRCQDSCLGARPRFCNPGCTVRPHNHVNRGQGRHRWEKAGAQRLR